MLPISEVHFAFCGIATVAATLGYACARRAVLSLSSPGEPSKAGVEAGPSEERSLKRKLDDSDDSDADAEEQSRPMKRNRTPPIDQPESDEDLNQEWEVVVPPPSYEQIVGLRQPDKPVQDKSTPPKEDYHTIEQNITPVREPTSPLHPENSSHSKDKGVEAERCSTPQPSQVNLSPNEQEIPPAHPMTPLKPTDPAKTVNAFSAFSGSSSPFTSCSNASGASPFPCSGRVVKSVPAWRHDNDNESDVFGRTCPANSLSPSLNNALTPTTTKAPVHPQGEGAFGVPSEMQPLTKPTACLTGEEDESVEADLKSVKLFVKRGRKEFTDGMYGHIKILTQKPILRKSGDEASLGTEAVTNSRTRLLFRRDPLGQVSMNVGLRPTVRCNFDTTENILRVILMEQVTTDGKDFEEDIVVYALKPGRAQKADFQSFVKTLCDHEGLKSTVPTDPTTPASGVTAAS